MTCHYTGFICWYPVIGSLTSCSNFTPYVLRQLAHEKISTLGYLLCPQSCFQFKHVVFITLHVYSASYNVKRGPLNTFVKCTSTFIYVNINQNQLLCITVESNITLTFHSVSVLCPFCFYGTMNCSIVCLWYILRSGQKKDSNEIDTSCCCFALKMMPNSSVPQLCSAESS